jgi:hypothetical protein
VPQAAIASSVTSACGAAVLQRGHVLPQAGQGPASPPPSRRRRCSLRLCSPSLQYPQAESYCTRAIAISRNKPKVNPPPTPFCPLISLHTFVSFGFVSPKRACTSATCSRARPPPHPFSHKPPTSFLSPATPQPHPTPRSGCRCAASAAAVTAAPRPRNHAADEGYRHASAAAAAAEGRRRPRHAHEGFNRANSGKALQRSLPQHLTTSRATGHLC